MLPEDNAKDTPWGVLTSDDSSGSPGDPERYERKLARMREYNAANPGRNRGRAKSQRVTQKMRDQALEVLRARHWQEYEQILEELKGRR